MTFIYRAYDDADRLLYVGIADRPLVRLGQHTGTGWAHHVAKVTFEQHSDRESATAAERSAIRSEDPVWNLDGRPVQRFMQWMAAYPDKHADDVTADDIEAMCRKIDRQVTAALRPDRQAVVAARIAELDGGAA